MTIRRIEASGDPDYSEFERLSKKKGLLLKRLSYACSNFDCINCDGKIHYKAVKERRGVIDGQFYGPYRDAKTGEMVDKKFLEDWDYERQSIQLTNGQTQNPENTPEGTLCECIFCHGRPGYDEWKARGGKPKPKGEKIKVKKRKWTKKEIKSLK